MKTATITLAFALKATADFADKSGCISGKNCGHIREETPCGLWLAESVLNPGTLAAFAGIDFDPKTTIGEPEIHIPIYDANKNEPSPWHEIVFDTLIEDDVLLQSSFGVNSFIPGLGSIVGCSDEEVTGSIDQRSAGKADGVGVHRSRNPTAGSFGYRSNSEFESIRRIRAGEELVMRCSENENNKNKNGKPKRYGRHLAWLKENGICIDKIFVKKSSLPNVGKGAFSKRKVKKGEIITSSPVIQLDRSQMEIVEQELDPSFNAGIKYTEHVTQKQLLLNYCYGHENSTVLLLPYGAGVNFINHHAEPNAIIRWSSSRYNNLTGLDLSAYDFLQRFQERMILDYIATRDIEAGEEIFIYYGDSWKTAWDKYLDGWEPPIGSERYVSAADYKARHPEEPIRTIEEQETNPYPENIVTSCLYFDNRDTNEVVWSSDNESCQRPCRILSRTKVGKTYFYTAEVSVIDNVKTPDACLMSNINKTVFEIPSRAINLVDRQYSSDQHMVASFRHEIQVPGNLFPSKWMWAEDEPEGSFLLEEMKPGDIRPIRWRHNRKVVTPHGLLMGTPSKIRESLLEYAERMGIIEIARDVTYRGNPLPFNSDEDIVLQGIDYHIQRPEAHWSSNMHWISPLNKIGHEDYLRVLSAAGFDEILQQLGDFFGYKHLTCFQLTFAAVSHCGGGYLHYDIAETGGRVFNFMIPLILVNTTSPELYFTEKLPDEESNLSNLTEAGRLRYRYDVANIIGDSAVHATGLQDYRLKKEMRLVATVCIGEIDEDNVGAILYYIATQNYPPQDRPDIYLSMAGKHWRRDDPSVKLPKPLTTDFDNNRLDTNEIERLTWMRSKLLFSSHAYRAGLPKTLRHHVLDYAKRTGIMRKFRLLADSDNDIAGNQFYSGRVETLGHKKWVIQRQFESRRSNIHRLSPADEASHENLLHGLFEGGFGDLLRRVGEGLEFDGLVAYKLSFIGVSYCSPGYKLRDTSETGGMGLTMIIPLIMLEESELQIDIEDVYDQKGSYKFTFDETLLIGDNVVHSVKGIEKSGNLTLFLSIDIADVNEENSGTFAAHLDQHYPPRGDSELLLSWAGRHWKSLQERKSDAAAIL